MDAIDRICSNLTSVLRKANVKHKCVAEDVSKNVFSIDIPIEDVDQETIDKLIRIAEKYKSFKRQTTIGKKETSRKLRLLFDTELKESFKFLKTFEAFSSGYATNEVEDEVDEEVEIAITKNDFKSYIKKTKNKTLYYFVEKTNDNPWVYIYSLENGNITRGNEGLWARQEVRSTSKAFHKDKENKKAVPNNLEQAAAIILVNYIKTKYKNSPMLDVMLNDRLRGFSDLTGVFED